MSPFPAAWKEIYSVFPVKAHGPSDHTSINFSHPSITPISPSNPPHPRTQPIRSHKPSDMTRGTRHQNLPTIPLWPGTNNNRDVSTGPLARPFARSLAPLTCSLTPDCLLRSRHPLRSLVRSLAHFAHSLARGKVNFLCPKMTWFCPIVRW